MAERRAQRADLADGPLTGVRVVDLTVAVQGPHAGAYLADMGADVVKVDAPGGEVARYLRDPGYPRSMDAIGTAYAAMNRGKRGISVDVHDELGREVLYRLIDAADVFVTNYRADALSRMGLDSATLRARNPRLIWARVSGYGPKGPDADKAMLDGTAQARSGLSGVTGPRDGGPTPPGAAVADHGGSMQLALGIITALYARERTGVGQEVNTSSLGAMMWMQAMELARSAMTGICPQRAGAHHPTIHCPYGVYETSDGGWFQISVAMSDESWDDFWVFAERPEMILEERWATAPRRIGAHGELEGVEEIPRCDASGVASHTTQEWADFLAAQPEIIAERVQSYDQVLADPQVAANGYLVDVDVPGFGPARMVSNVVQLSDTPGRTELRSPPRLGEHTAEVMRELGFAEHEVDHVLSRVEGVAQQVIDLVVPPEGDGSGAGPGAPVGSAHADRG